MGLDDEKGGQEFWPRGPSSMLPLSSVIKDAFDTFEHDFQAANLPEGKYIKPPSTTKWYKVGQPCYEKKIQKLNTYFAKISNPQHLNLHVWCLGLDSSKNKTSLWRWQTELLPLRGHQQGPSTSQTGPYLRNGAEKIQWISPFHL